MNGEPSRDEPYEETTIDFVARGYAMVSAFGAVAAFVQGWRTEDMVGLFVGWVLLGLSIITFWISE